MKRFFTMVAATFMATIALQAQDLNIYASGLSAGTVDNTNKEVKISYTLNAPATTLEVILQETGEMALAPIAITDPAALTKGAHTDVAVDLTGVPGGDYAWSIKAEGAATGNEPTPAGSTASTFTTPRGLAIDNNYDSPYFGHIYVSDSKNAATTGGIYIFDAALSDFTSQGSTAYTTGWSNSPASPMRVTVAPDNRVYITDWSDNATSGVYIWNPATPATNAAPVFGGTVTGGNAYENGAFIHGSVSHCYVEGTGANTKLYTFDEDIIGIFGLNNTCNVFRYDIGELTQSWTAPPSAVIYKDDTSDSNKGLQQNGNSKILPDNKGGWWISQHRASDGATIPCLIHMNSEGTVDYNSSGLLTQNAYNQGTLVLNADQNLLGCAISGAIKIFDVTYDQTTDAPSLTLKYTISTDFTTTCYEVEFDVAENVYAFGNAKPLKAWALPKADNSFTTPAPSASVLAVDNGTGIGSQVAGKAVKSVQYFDLTGKPATNATKGFVIKKTIYKDGSIKNGKAVK